MTELELTKAKLGITSTARDAYLTELINAVYGEWESINGVRLSAAQKATIEIIDLVADVAAFKYQNHGGGLPPNLRLRLNNLYVKYAGLPEVGNVQP